MEFLRSISGKCQTDGGLAYDRLRATSIVCSVVCSSCQATVSLDCPRLSMLCTKEEVYRRIKQTLTFIEGKLLKIGLELSIAKTEPNRMSLQKYYPPPYEASV